MIEEAIYLQPHDPAWLVVFDKQSVLLKASLGEYITAIHHVGSTAISSIQAKPIVDVTIESSVYPPNEFIVNKLSELGYLARGDGGVAGRTWFTKGEPRTVNLHWCPLNGEVARSQVRFRNALRSDEQLARRYEKLKNSASLGKHIDSSEYSDAKDNFISDVLSEYGADSL